MSRPPVGFGVQIACEGMGWPECLEIAQAAEELGYHSVWLPDHYAATPDGLIPSTRTPLCDGWLALAAIAQATCRIRLGPLVASITFRNPGILAKLGATLDHISGGRCELGMGAGWFEREHTSLGIPFPPLPQRVAALEEAVRVVKALWTQPEVSFQGRYYQLDGAISEPKPLQRPHPPIAIGASGERIALLNVARHADHWNTYCTAALFQKKRDVLLDHCAAVGRDPQQILRSVMLPLYLEEDEAVKRKLERWGGGPNAREWFLVGAEAEIQDRIARFVEAGAQLVIVQVDRSGRCAQTLREFQERFF